MNDTSYYDQNVYEERLHVLWSQREPSVLFQQSLKVGLDGDKYFVLFGPNIMEGVSGYGSTMDEAMQDFNRNWVMQKAPNPTGAGA